MKGKYLDKNEIAGWRETLRAEGKKLVVTNGCFDLLHVGHVRYLSQARALGDVLLVAVNSDHSVRQLKGMSRPVHPESDRAEVLSALTAVDHVTIFDEVRCESILRTVQPDIYVKGGDYTVETLDEGERGVLEEVGAKIRILPLVPGRSTTNTIERMRS